MILNKVKKPSYPKCKKKFSTYIIYPCSIFRNTMLLNNNKDMKTQLVLYNNTILLIEKMKE